MLIALAGLPGTGKTTLAIALAKRLNAVLLNKDHVRACLFAPKEIEYSRSQDDLVVSILYQLAEFHLLRRPSRPVILDGRTYSQTYQIDDLNRCAARCQAPLKIIECTCSDEVALARLAADRAHPATDRGPELYHRVKATWQATPEPKLVIATDTDNHEGTLTSILDYVASPPCVP